MEYFFTFRYEESAEDYMPIFSVQGYRNDICDVFKLMERQEMESFFEGDWMPDEKRIKLQVDASTATKRLNKKINEYGIVFL